jgi:hypothetical protein
MAQQESLISNGGVNRSAHQAIRSGINTIRQSRFPMIFLRTVAILASAHAIVGAIWIASVLVSSDLDSTNHYPFGLIFGGVLFICLNIGFYKYFSERMTRLFCLGLAMMSTYYCYQTDSYWRYSMKLIDQYQHNYTREWYCNLPYKDKLLIESYTTHGIEDCH